MIRYSRHAKRRMKLYNIDKNDIENSINIGTKKIDNEGNIVFLNKLKNKKFPLKIVSKLVENDYFVITCYPLKKGYKQ